MQNCLFHTVSGTMTHRIVLAALLCLLSWPAFSQDPVQQLRELEVEQTLRPPDFRKVIPDYPEYPFLVFRSSLSDLKFQSNWQIVADLSTPETGEYILVVDTVRQSLRISVPDAFRRTEISIPKLAPKQTLYYRIEPAGYQRFREIMSLYDARDYEAAVEQLNAFLLMEDVATNQRNNALYLLALCHHALGRDRDLRQTIRSLITTTPAYTSSIQAAPREVMSYVEFVKDSLHAVPPAPPANPRVNYANNRVTLSWSANAEEDLAGYHVYRGTNPGVMTRLVTVGTSATSYVDNEVTQYETYFYHIEAFDDHPAESTSDPSELLTVEIIPLLSARTEVILGPDSPVRNVRLSQENEGTMTISYSLSGEYRRTYDVSMMFATSMSGNFNITPNAVSGDIGANVHDGNFKQITWNVGEDFEEGIPGRQFRLLLEAAPQPLAEQVHLVSADSTIDFAPLEALNDSVVVIQYDLVGPRKQEYDLSFSVSDERGRSYTVPPSSISGDWKGRKKPSKTNTIEWNILSAFPEGLEGSLELALTATPVLRNKNRWRYYTAAGVVAVGALSLFIIEPPPPSQRVSTDFPERPQ